MSRAVVRRVALAALSTALVLASALALITIAQSLFTARLRDQAAQSLEYASSGQTPYSWKFASDDDIVAGHPFDAAEFNFGSGALQVVSGPGAFSVGVRIERNIDASHFPIVQVDFDSTAPGTFALTVREALDGPEWVSDAIPFSVGRSQLSLDLRTVSWVSHANNRHWPEEIAMLRAVVLAAAGTKCQFHTVSLMRPHEYRKLDLAAAPRVIDPGENCDPSVISVFRLPLRDELQKEDIRAIARARCVQDSTLILLPQHGRVEQQIKLRNRVFAALPWAILIPENAVEQTFAQARAGQATRSPGEPPTRLPWSVVALYTLLVFSMVLRPPAHRRLRALLEIALVLAGPAWLVIGGHFDGRLRSTEVAWIILTLAYSASLSVPRGWRWSGTTAAWMWAAGVVFVAVAAGLLLQAGNAEPSSVGLSQIVRYFAWALLQQYLICAVCAERFNIVCGNALIATWLGALCFALLHTPNGSLMLVTFAGGLCWCAIYLRYRALLPLAVSHALSALVLIALLPSDILHSAEVSVRFFQ